jgi:hypothetical protein
LQSQRETSDNVQTLWKWWEEKAVTDKHDASKQLDLLEEAVPLLSFSNNVIEHLGIKLYRNKTGNVMAELLANSWDADATQVEITIHEASADFSLDKIVIADNGCGMNYDHIKDHYLKVGKAKRRKPTERSQKGRTPMGRKGLGKLAPFGIARRVDIATIQEGFLNWFTLNLDDILKIGEEGGYPPSFHSKAAPIASPVSSSEPEFDKLVDEFRTDTLKKAPSEQHGTLICLTGITANQLPDPEQTIQDIGRKFTVVLLRDDFCVRVNDQEITEEAALPDFEFRIPETGSTRENVDGKPVDFWVGFVSSPEWSSDQAGVGVFAHGKSAQARPFFFNKKGKEVFQRYLYGVVSADWIDEEKEDLISTDRTSVDWSDERLTSLYDWGQKKVGAWITAYEAFRKERLKNEVTKQADKLRADGRANNYTKAENAQLDALVAEATASVGKSKSAIQTREELLIAVSKAWINQPTRQMLTDLWSKLNKKQVSAEALTTIVTRLSEHSVPEAMGLALTFAQRAYALSVLYELIHENSETNLQDLIESFPWILQPRGDLLTSDRTLKTTIEKAADEMKRDEGRIGRTIREMSERERADFVFLTDPDKQSIQIVEIKGPLVAIGLEEERQLADYLDFVRARYSDAHVSGVLIGQIPKTFQAQRRDMTAKTWAELLRECRASYVDMLASMIEVADLSPDDSRFGAVRDFGGEETWALLNQMAEKNDVLKKLLEKQADHDKQS